MATPTVNGPPDEFADFAWLRQYQPDVADQGETLVQPEPEVDADVLGRILDLTPHLLGPVDPPPADDYRTRVTMGLLLDATGLLIDHGICWGEGDWRRARAMVALCALADAMAGPGSVADDPWGNPA
jgi:hypothetical protein